MVKPGRGKVSGPVSHGRNVRGGRASRSGRAEGVRGQQRSGLKMKSGWQPQQQQHQEHQKKQEEHRRQRHINKKPPPFPAFRGPVDRFVGESDPQFLDILETCYDGFRVEAPDTFDPEVHDAARLAFDGLEEGGVFRADVTQPFGLGTKCAATYVTRTLLGDPGTTYKYLGLRMFSIPWTQGSNGDGSALSSGRGSDALAPVRRLNDHLSKRARHLLEERTRRLGNVGGEGRSATGDSGSCSFNVALINRMEPSEARPDLKLEPTFGRDRCSVSWHADSCLEHFSTIAVYHVTEPETNPADWRIALRVEPDAEGPSSGKLSLGRNTRDEAERAPPVAVSLPSRSSYFLLGGFNHHHQHAVLSGTSHRWSSTHRVAKKEGHTFDYIYGRCQAVLKDGHRRTLKQWRAEQLTLSELEFEWIRQFYVQGQAHYDLRSWWHRPMNQLLHQWTMLERKTDAVLSTLQGASEAIADESHGAKDKASEEDSQAATEERRRAKKARQKRAKQRQAVEAVGGRAAFVVMAEALRERADRRRLWKEREADKVFKRLPEDGRPLACPLFSEHAAPSPLPGTPHELRALADTVLRWGSTSYAGEKETGVSYAGGVCAGRSAAAVAARGEAGDANDRDHAEGTESMIGDEGDRRTNGIGDGVEGNSSKGSGNGCGSESLSLAPPWQTGRFALEMQSPWSKRLLNGEKTVETRSYALPAGLLGRPIEVMESQPGRDGVSALGDTVEAFSHGLSVLGRVVFKSSEAYTSQEAWARDEPRHLVPPSSVAYGWSPPPRSVYGWTVGEVTAYPKPRAVRRMQRAFRSLFEVEGPPRQGEIEGCGDETRTKKKAKTKKKRKRKGGIGAGVSSEGGGVVKAGSAVIVPAVDVGVDKRKPEAVRPGKKRRKGVHR